MGEPGENQASWERDLHAEFCAFLNSDRPEAGLSADEVVTARGKRYIELHAKLARLFAWRGCHESETLADRALERAEHKWAQRRDTGEEAGSNVDPSAYVCGFVRFIFLEWVAEQHKLALPVPPEGSGHDEAALECLDRCMNEVLEPEERKVILEYYCEEKRAKIDHRRTIAVRHNVSVNALRIECCRIRRQLRTCVIKCMQWKESAEMIPEIGALSNRGRQERM
jgi:hypothetical protein